MTKEQLIEEILKYDYNECDPTYKDRVTLKTKWNIKGLFDLENVVLHHILRNLRVQL